MSNYYYRLAVVSALLLVTSSPVWADDYDDAARLLKQGNTAAALKKADAAIAANKDDPRPRFLKGLILTERNETQAAIDVFTSLTRDYPELPEPYNNLAVLYAAQGQYDQARESLEMAIRTHPSYAVAHENLGDVYAKMASEAYDKALSLDRSNQTAQTKLSLIRTGAGRDGCCCAQTKSYGAETGANHISAKTGHRQRPQTVCKQHSQTDANRCSTETGCHQRSETEPNCCVLYPSRESANGRGHGCLELGAGMVRTGCHRLPVALRTELRSTRRAKPQRLGKAAPQSGQPPQIDTG
jgi:tetratricopeptide (TPR) repeat protein